jgi:two-component system, LytTR family, sensor kinase
MAHFLLRFRWHILFWVLYFIGWTSLSVYSYRIPVWIALVVTLAWFLGQAAMIYLTVYRWVPRFLKPRRIGLFVGALAGTLFGGAIFTSVSGYGFLKLTMASYPYSFSAFFGYVILGNVYWVLLAVGVTVLRDRLRNDRRNQRLEKEHTENELRFLKSQMNPHFLFNAINSIYVLIRKDPDLAEHTLARFSDMLRYQLYDCSTDFIPIEKEITYLENYIRLEQLRKGPALTIDYTTEEAIRHFSIAPLLLMPLVENAFKFVSSFTDRENQVRIRLLSGSPQFHLEISNTVDDPAPVSTNPGSMTPGPPRTTSASTGAKTGSEPPSGGIGLENVRRRLELLYPKKHSLEIEANKEHYTVSLKLQVV